MRSAGVIIVEYMRGNFGKWGWRKVVKFKKQMWPREEKRNRR